ncbi:DUF4132 domain-containing protein [Catellatospora sp. NPDC049609]|uniref:DUF4132 domain-containing protein n=1 Tax=Catellatospora sp. NPDC049609 TaxID=3155505 RepID=UPI00341E90AF
MTGRMTMGWLPTGSGYDVALDKGRVVCRNAQGTRLRSLPASLKDDPVVAELRQLRDWLARHEAECVAEVERWMVRGLPVTLPVLTRVWADDAWRGALRDLVVTPYADGVPDLGRAGFLRDVDAGRGLGVVGLDGESARLSGQLFAVPHPVLLDDLDELREFAAELDVRQGVTQLFREAYRKPADDAACRAVLAGYAEARYAQLRHATTRATALGCVVRAGTARSRCWADGGAVDASIWLGDGDPGAEAMLGELEFTDAQGRGLGFGEVPPIVWSEGVRLAAALHAAATGGQGA